MVIYGVIIILSGVFLAALLGVGQFMLKRYWGKSLSAKRRSKVKKSLGPPGAGAALASSGDSPLSLPVYGKKGQKGITGDYEYRGYKIALSWEKGIQRFKISTPNVSMHRFTIRLEPDPLARSSPGLITGDAEFDSLFSVTTMDRYLLMAQLEDKIRFKIKNLVRGLRELEINSFHIWGSFIQGKPLGEDILEEFLAGCLDLFEQLEKGGDVRHRLLGNFRDSADWGYRRRLLMLLAKSFPKDHDIQNILKRSLLEKDYSLAEFAFDTLGEEAVAIYYMALASKKIISRVSPEVIANMIRLLVSKEGDEYFRWLAKDYFEIRSPKVIEISLMEGHKLNTPQVRQFLLKVIEDNYSPWRIKAIRGLGGCGEGEDLMLLYDLDAHSTTYHEAVLAAIKEIKQRIEGGEAGWLTVADPGCEQGHLSVTGNEEGSGSLSVNGENNKG